jgi:tetratricopeptide (TPR) repeat protein
VLGSSSPEVAEMLESLADVRVRLGDFHTADTTYAAARRLRRDDPLAVGRIGLKTARSASQQGNYPLSSSRVRRAQAALGDVDLPGAERLRLDLEMRAGYTAFRRGKLAAARATCIALVEHTDESIAPDIVAEALGVLDLAELGLGLPADPTRTERALTLSDRLGNLSDQARLLNQTGYRAYFAGRWAEALDLYIRARDLFSRTGDVPNAAVADANIAEILVDQGRAAEAETSLRSALHTWRAAGTWNDAAFAYSLLGRVLARQGQYDEARAALDQARTHFEAQGARTEVVDADTYRAELLFLEGKTAEALGLADATLGTAASLSDLPAQAPLLHRIVAACLDSVGDTEAATREYAEALAIARQREAAHDVAFTLTAMTARARAAGIEPDPAWLEEAAELRGALGLVIDVTDRSVSTSGAGRRLPTG